LNSISYKYVFLVGCPRSGTTLLQEMLNAHPSIALAPELFYIRNYINHPEQIGPLASIENRQKLAEDIVNQHWFPKLYWETQNFKEWILSKGKSHKRVYRGLLEQYGSRKSAQWIGDKTPNNILYIQQIVDLFPNARFIHIVRDPRAVVNSWKKVPWTTGSRTGDAKVWRKYNKAIFSVPSNIRSKIYTVIYKELLTHPKKELTGICHFLSLDYTEEMESYTAMESSFEIKKEPWKAKANRPPDPNRINSWKNSLTKTEITAIESITTPLMRKWNYQPISPLWLRLLFWPFRLVLPYWTYFFRKMRDEDWISTFRT